MQMKDYMSREEIMKSVSAVELQIMLEEIKRKREEKNKRKSQFYYFWTLVKCAFLYAFNFKTLKKITSIEDSIEYVYSQFKIFTIRTPLLPKHLLDENVLISSRERKQETVTERTEKWDKEHSEIIKKIYCQNPELMTNQTENNKEI